MPLHKPFIRARAAIFAAALAVIPPAFAVEEELPLIPAAEIAQALLHTAPSALDPPQCRGDSEGFALAQTSSHVSLPGILFEIGKAEVMAKSMPQVDEVIKAVQSILLSGTQPPFRILIEGHTCDIGNAEKNRELSRNRAESVRACLMSKGVPGEILEISGWGEEHPCVPNLSEIERRRNRRIDFVLRRRCPSTAQAVLGPLLNVRLTSYPATGGTVTDCPNSVALKTGDGVRLAFTALESCHVYVLGMGSSGTVRWLFPKEGTEHARFGVWCYFGEEHALPDSDETRWFRLDPPAGAETIFVVAASTPLPNPGQLSDLLQQADLTCQNFPCRAGTLDAELHLIKIMHD